MMPPQAPQEQMIILVPAGQHQSVNTCTPLSPYAMAWYPADQREHQAQQTQQGPWQPSCAAPMQAVPQCPTAPVPQLEPRMVCQDQELPTERHADSGSEAEAVHLREAAHRLTSSAARRLRRKRAAERQKEVEVEDAPGNLEEIKWMLEANRPEAAARKLRGHVYTFAHDAVACRVVQEAIERTGSRTAVELAQELKGHILDLAVCPHGNYVVQKVVSHLSVAASHFVLEELRGHAARTAKHRFACRILCRLLEFCGSASAELVEELLQDAESLCCHSFAHHVIQSVLEHGEGRHKERVAKALLSDPFRFSTHKHSSYLIEKALCYCSEDDQQKFLDVLGSPQMILELANTQYGCYVARALLQDDRLNSEKAIRLLKRNRAELEQTKHGYRFLSEMGLTE